MIIEMIIIETLKVSKNVTIVDGVAVEGREIVLHLARHATSVVGKTTSELCITPVTKNLSQSMTQGQIGPGEKIDMI